MDPSLTALLSSYKKRQLSEDPDADYLFESDRVPGTPFLGWTFRRWFLTVMEQAGISNDRDEKYRRGISPHTLRHYFAYKSFLQSEEKGLTLEQYAPYLSAYLGHRSLLETENILRQTIRCTGIRKNAWKLRSTMFSRRWISNDKRIYTAPAG